MTKSILSVLLIAAWLQVDSVAQAPATPQTHITLGAQNVSGGRTTQLSETASGGNRTTTAHLSGFEVTVGTIDPTPIEVTLKWFWVGRYVSSGNYFRSDDGTQKVTVDSTKPQKVFAESSEIDSHVTETKKGSYKSGGKLLGWVVTAEDAHGVVLASTASNMSLIAFATKPPPKQRK